MPLPVIANTYRVALKWDPAGGVAPVNVFNYQTTAPATVAQVAAKLTTAIELSSALWTCMSTGQILSHMGITLLDGIRAEEDFSFTPTSGGSSGQLLPAVAALLSFKSLQKGPRGRGRMYIGPCCEDAVNTGQLVSSVQAAMQTAWDNFFTSTATAGAGSGSIVVASYKHADTNAIETHLVETIVATQRRRQSQLRSS